LEAKVIGLGGVSFVIGLGGVSFVSGLEWRRSPGFSIGLNVRTAFLRVEATAGINAHIIFGENDSRVDC